LWTGTFESFFSATSLTDITMQTRRRNQTGQARGLRQNETM
jgi:hypothetical protein